MYVYLQTVLHGPKDVRSSKQILLTVIRYTLLLFFFLSNLRYVQILLVALIVLSDPP